MSEEVRALPEKLLGGCMCGAVRYRISEAPIAAALCHCDRKSQQSQAGDEKTRPQNVEDEK
jgi:hypothetical protein